MSKLVVNGGSKRPIPPEIEDPALILDAKDNREITKPERPADKPEREENEVEEGK